MRSERSIFKYFQGNRKRKKFLLSRGCTVYFYFTFVSLLNIVVS